MSIEEGRELLQSSGAPTLLDCRESWEHALCRIGGEEHIPLGEIEERANELDRTRPVLVYCHHGVRSVNAAVILERAGFEAMSLRGGIDQWSLRVDPNVPRY